MAPITMPIIAECKSENSFFRYVLKRFAILILSAFLHNAALSGAPKGHPSPVPGSPRSVAEVQAPPLSAAFPPERSGGGNKLFYGFCISPISMGS